MSVVPDFALQLPITHERPLYDRIAEIVGGRDFSVTAPALAWISLQAEPRHIVCVESLQGGGVRLLGCPIARGDDIFPKVVTLREHRGAHAHWLLTIPAVNQATLRRLFVVERVTDLPVTAALTRYPRPQQVVPAGIAVVGGLERMLVWMNPNRRDAVVVSYPGNRATWSAGTLSAQGDRLFVRVDDGRTVAAVPAAGRWGERICALMVQATLGAAALEL